MLLKSPTSPRFFVLVSYYCSVYVLLLLIIIVIDVRVRHFGPDHNVPTSAK